MPNTEQVQDPLKALNKVFEPDERQQYIVGGLEDIHAELSTIELNTSVPISVRQLFETAKNLSLYSWFVYRFHQVSETVSFSALEMALRERYQAENDQSNKTPPSLYKLLQHAKTEKWITNEGFPSRLARARHLAKHNKYQATLATRDFNEKPSAFVEEPSEEEIEAALGEIDMVKAVTENTSILRNNLAHGSSALHPTSISTLRLASEVINQIYP